LTNDAGSSARGARGTPARCASAALDVS
jgi:hypothetical protein